MPEPARVEPDSADSVCFIGVLRWGVWATSVLVRPLYRTQRPVLCGCGIWIKAFPLRSAHYLLSKRGASGFGRYFVGNVPNSTRLGTATRLSCHFRTFGATLTVLWLRSRDMGRNFYFPR